LHGRPATSGASGRADADRPPCLRLLTFLLGFAVAFSVGAFAGVPGWARMTLVVLSLAAGGLALACPPRPQTWLGAPLSLPVLVLLGWSCLQLLPVLPGGLSLSLAPAITLHALIAVASFWSLHIAAATALAEHRRRDSFVVFLALFGLVVAIQALAQAASWTWKIYWVFERYGESIPFGAFWNRNHYATYMAMLVPIGLGWLEPRLSRCSGVLRSREGLRTCLQHMGSREGALMMAVLLACFAMGSSLIVSRSRGGILALLVALGIGAWGRRRSGLALLVLSALAILMARHEVLAVLWRFGAGVDESRLAVWAASLRALEGARWLTGYGLGTFAVAATEAVRYLQGVGLKLDGMAGFAHNEYLQILVETGLPGLGVVLWGVARVLGRSRGDRWLTAALAAAAFHATVDFSFHTPAVAVLLAVLSALPGDARSSAQVD
jgi:O-antigen ligase